MSFSVPPVDDATAMPSERQRDVALQRFAGSVARLGGWAVDLSTDDIHWSEELRRLLSIPDGSSPGPDGIRARYAPEDQQRVADAVNRCRHDGTPFDLEAALTDFAGNPMIVRIVGERDAEGRYLLGALQDVTSYRQADATALQLANQLAMTLEAITDAVFTLDRSWRFTYLNRSAERLFGAARDTLIGEDVWSAFPSIVGGEVEVAYRQAMTDNVATSISSYFCAPLDTWVEEQIFPAPQGLTVFLSDIGEQVRRHEAQQRVIDAERNAADRLRELDKMKNAFLSAVSHELRTPLAIVQGAAATLQRLRDELPDDRRRELEDALVEQSSKLAALLENLLDIDRLTRHQNASSRRRIDIAATAQRVIAGLEGADRVTINSPSRLPIIGHEVHTEQIIANLVGNALKYAPDSDVEVRLRRFAGNRVLLEVHDDGPGIPDEEMERIFEPFHRVDTAHPKPGTGIGLTLVAEFARMQGGRAWAEPAERGAHFYVDLPAPARGLKLPGFRARRADTPRPSAESPQPH